MEEDGASLKGRWSDYDDVEEWGRSSMHDADLVEVGIGTLVLWI